VVLKLFSITSPLSHCPLFQACWLWSCKNKGIYW